MSIFGRKEIAELKEKQKVYERRLQISESENARLNEKCSRYQSALNQADKETEDYKRKYNELLASVSDASVSADDERAEPLDYREQTEKSKNETKNPIYTIFNKVRNNPEYMSALYLSKDSFLSPNEYKMFFLVEDLVYENRDVFGSLYVFANTRFADIVKLFEDKYNSGDNSFCGMQHKNRHKKEICALIDEHMPDFNDEDYKSAFLYPLLRLHADILICDGDGGDDKLKPILAIELNGPEHDRNSDNPDWNKIHNDEFKKSLFDFGNNAMGVRLLVIKNEELEDTDKLTNKVYEAVERCLQSPPEPVGNKKWNNTVYGNKGEYYIFADGSKTSITDEAAERLRNYVNDMRDFFGAEKENVI